VSTDIRKEDGSAAPPAGGGPKGRLYELVYIVAPEASEQQVTDLHTQVEEIVGRFGGRIEKTDNWGRRRLAYEIGRHKEGTYVLEVISGSGDLIKELDRRLRVIDEVIRHVVIRVDEENKVVDRARAKRQVVQEKRAARGLPERPRRDEQDGDDRGDDRFGTEVES
jgi:small subunit ribosomal protein S6